MDLFGLFVGLFVGGVVGMFFGALFTQREMKKDELFYKDCIRTLRGQLIEAEKEKDDEDTRTYPGAY